jgi:hypothetical protein
MMPQPRLGDAFGELMRAALAEEAGAGLKPTVGGTLPGGVVEIVEPNPATKIIAQGMDPYGTEDDLHLAYHAANQAAGRLAGELRLRVRYRGIATDWFDYLLCTPGELEDLVGATPWRIEDVDRADAPFYTAVLRLR